MKITIDTKEDSHEDLRKVMEILNHFVTVENKIPQASSEESASMMNMFSTPQSESSKLANPLLAAAEPVKESEPSSAPMSMFNVPPPKHTQQDTAPSFPSILNLNKEESKEEPKVQFF
jgi:hypothetical protein